MKIEFLGATQTVTGSKFLVTAGNKKILVDCGLFQGFKELRLRNWATFPIEPSLIDAVVLTHAHIDHSGYLPVLVKRGFSGKVYCTPATIDLCSILLPDSGFLQEEEARRANKYKYSKHRPAFPLYTRDEAVAALSQFVPVEFGHDHQLNKNISIRFNVAGHILGAASVILQHEGKSIGFSGDLGRPHDPLMYPPQTLPATDYLVIESTYGDQEHGEDNPQDHLASIINRTLKRSGTLIIPAFAVGRSQLLLYYIYNLKKAGIIPNVPVFLDSPLATNATNIFQRYAKEHRLSVAECAKIFGAVQYVNDVEQSKLIDTDSIPKIIISASGMAVGGRVLHHLHHFVGDSRNTILFCGFQTAGTRGEKMLRGIEEIKLLGEVVRVNAEVVALNNISAHADSKEILDWLATTGHAPKKVFITHGEIKAANELKRKIEQRFKWNCIIPRYLQEENLI